MPNGQIAGCDAVVERTAVAAFTANRHRRRGGITLYITVSGGGVCGTSPPARVAGHFTGGVSVVRWRRRKHEQLQRQWKRWWPWTVVPLRWRCRNYAQEHRTHAVASRQTGTFRLKYDIIILCIVHPSMKSCDIGTVICNRGIRIIWLRPRRDRPA